jgi:hypothetical protein
MTREAKIKQALDAAHNPRVKESVAKSFLRNGGEDARIVQRLYSFSDDSRQRSTKRVGIYNH